jgi:transposase InsO family protein
VKRLHEICHPHDPPSHRRGAARQLLTREREAILRSHVVELTRWTAQRGLSLPATADLLHLAPRTLRLWCADFRIEVSPIHLLGRPTLRSSLSDRTAVLDVLKELGPTTSVATLRACFPQMPRAELTDLVGRYRRVWRQRYQAEPCTLCWRRIGAVWALDFSEPPQPIDGIYPYLLAVRDLASHQQLLWLPVENMTAATAIAALRMLFTLHGAPLVLKADNGSAFIADATQAFLSGWGANLLFSPAYTPEYNGSIEAGNGSMKTRTECYASRAGHPGEWMYDDVIAAPIEANATARPQGETGPTPNELWRARRPLSTEERRLFQQTVSQYRDLQEAKPQSTQEERRMQREAIRCALVEHGILWFLRRRNPLTINYEKTANIT